MVEHQNWNSVKIKKLYTLETRIHSRNITDLKYVIMNLKSKCSQAEVQNLTVMVERA